MKIGIHNNLRHTQNSDVVGVASATAAAAATASRGGVGFWGWGWGFSGGWRALALAFVRRVGAVGCVLWVVGCRALAPRAFLLRRFRLTPHPLSLESSSFHNPTTTQHSLKHTYTQREDHMHMHTHTHSHTYTGSAFYYCALAARASEGTNQRTSEGTKEPTNRMGTRERTRTTLAANASQLAS